MFDPPSTRDVGRNRDDDRDRDALYFFPDRRVTGEDLRRILAEGSRAARAEAISCLLRYAEWSHIWRFVTREEVREIFPDLDLPETLRQAWARMLKLELSKVE
jgi:hypothetical protein